MSTPMHHREIIEAEAIHREDALLRIAELVKRYGITHADLAAALPNLFLARSVEVDRPKANLFDPFLTYAEPASGT